MHVVLLHALTTGLAAFYVTSLQLVVQVKLLSSYASHLCLHLLK